MAFKQMLDITAQHFRYVCNTFVLSKEMKDKCIAIIQKQIIIKIIIWWRESYKTLMQIWKDSCGMVLVSPSVTHRLTSDSKPISVLQWRESHCGPNTSVRRKKEIQKSRTVRVTVRDLGRKVNHLSKVI